MNYETITPTAWMTAYQRSFTDIPYSREILAILEKEVAIPKEIKNTQLAPQFEARYKLINILLRQQGINQVIELAAGLSPRGLEFTEDPTINYVELDTRPISILKTDMTSKLMRNIARPNLHIVEGNALNTTDLGKALAFVSREESVAIINEGLMRYFTFDEKQRLAKNIHRTLQTQGGVWITSDISLKKILKTEDEIQQNHTKTISQITARDINQNLFESVERAEDFFSNLGFAVEKYSFLEVTNELTSPKALHITQDEVRKMNQDAVVFVMSSR